MRFPPERAGWYAMAQARELHPNKALRRYLFNTPILLFGSAAQPRAVVDRCPHRGAPLSQGRVEGDTVRCGYHGWTFTGDGRLADMPCLAGELPGVKLHTFETCVHLGLVFIKLGQAPDRPYTNPLVSQLKFWRALPGDADAELADAAENFLDPSHTYFVHKHLVRGKKAVPTTVEVTAGADRAEARYYGEGAAGGLIPAVMGEKERVLSVGRFIGPNVSEVEFHGPAGVNFVMTGYMTPARDGEVTGYGVVGLPGGKPWARLKFMLLWPWIRLVHSQDRNILKTTRDNNVEFGDVKRMAGPLDVLRPQIDAILAGKPPPAQAQPTRVTMLL
ncbi:Rieske 2Fe-2S domain-containing protein [Ramlibacter sp. WS9]|uniref:Rieske 2Fe-2S domain-containing protein n=1 Tax=Ramlibacter sp. WS9 TaxID=1882741 RepID=UPI001141709C|nr:Rieske 2Fe-2S domain-containing protein [Ramlibacter sp. WS9]ROZ74325.1 hypothetical protein EEB15_17395 [Ramlibacter sp. WS9]